MLFSILLLMCTTACQPVLPPVVEKGETERRLASIEKSLAKIRIGQAQNATELQKIALRQKLLKKGMMRIESRQKIHRGWIAYIGENSQEDGSKIEDISLVLGRVIEPLSKMRNTLIDLEAKISRMQVEQGSVAQEKVPPQGPVKPQALQTPRRPVDLKKKKKVMESVA